MLRGYQPHFIYPLILVNQDLELVFPELVTNQKIHIADKVSDKINKLKIDDSQNTKEITSEKKSGTRAGDEITHEEFKGINYLGLVSILTEGIKEATVANKFIDSEVESLRKRNRVS
jgi:hypothetical protein